MEYPPYTVRKKKQAPKYLFLENVDRLLKSTSNQRGRDFAIMLKSLDTLGYAVEWRVINAADYGMPQRRRRIFFLGYHKSSPLYKKIKNTETIDWVLTSGTVAKAFPASLVSSQLISFPIDDDLVTLSNSFNLGEKLSPFQNTGVFINGMVHTIKTEVSFDGQKTVLGDILEKGPVAEEFYIKEEEYPKWEYLKGSKKEMRTAKSGFSYSYSEGSMVFPDALNNASRTIITGEGGKSPSRFKHVVQTQKGLRRLTPVELERLNMFPDNHTQLTGISNTKRAFFMGNALVVGVVQKIAESLYSQISEVN